MSKFKNIENELDPRLQQMLKAYSVVPARDPEYARRDQERFVAILNMIFEEQAPSKAAVGWFTLSAWPSSFKQIKEIFVNSRRMRALLFVLVILIVFAMFLFGGTGITAYAASSSLPGDGLYPLKTAMETTRAGLTFDSAAQARLYIEYAGRRLSEIQSLIDQGRYGDISQAASEFEKDLQRSLSAIESLSQTDPARAIGLSAEMIAILRGYNDILTQLLATVPADAQPAIQSAIKASQSAATSLDATYDPFNLDNEELEDENGVTPSPQASELPQPTTTPQRSLEAGATLEITSTFTALPVVIQPPPATATPNSTATSTGNADLGVEGRDVTCRSSLGVVIVENLFVPQGASCTLDGTRVRGNIKVDVGASLTAHRVTIIGNIQAEGASFVEVSAGSTVGGGIQMKQGGSSRIEFVIVNGDIQLESNNDVLSVVGNQVGGNVQVFQNGGGVTITDNTINGNLQCKENNPSPIGENNVVQGNKEDQCAGL
jgi:hypothetical protein